MVSYLTIPRLEDIELLCCLSHGESVIIHLNLKIRLFGVIQLVHDIQHYIVLYSYFPRSWYLTRMMMIVHIVSILSCYTDTAILVRSRGYKDISILVRISQYDTLSSIQQYM